MMFMIISQFSQRKGESEFNTATAIAYCLEEDNFYCYYFQYAFAYNIKPLSMVRLLTERLELSR